MPGEGFAQEVLNPAHGSGRILQVLSTKPHPQRCSNPAHGSERMFKSTLFITAATPVG